MRFLSLLSERISRLTVALLFSACIAWVVIGIKADIIAAVEAITLFGRAWHGFVLHLLRMSGTAGIPRVDAGLGVTIWRSTA
jgi:hypothetical protein